MFLREATTDDSSIILTLMLTAFSEYEGVLDPPSAAHKETLETIAARLSRGSAVLAEVDHVPVGFAFYEPQDDFLYFSRLSVLPGFRQQGIGRALIDYVERRAAERRAVGVRLGVRLQLLDMLATYERLGYRKAKYGFHQGYPDPTYVYMEKPTRSA